jgi:hypothetical protein
MKRRGPGLLVVVLFLAVAPVGVGATTISDLSGYGHTGTLGVGFTGATAPTVNPSYLSFTNPNDTILLTGDVALSAQATYEAIVRFSTTTYPAGSGSLLEGGIWDSWQSNAQDTRLSILNGGTPLAYAWPVNIPYTVGSLVTDHWYDIAYVYDGSQERMYIDGTLIHSRSSSGSIRTGASTIMTVGAIFRDNGIVPSFQGDLQSLRISDTARYSGNSYAANFSYFGPDASTQLLISVPEPSSGAVACAFAGGFLFLRRRSRCC